MIKSFKLKKSHYWNLEQLMYYAEVVRGKNAYPERLFVNKKTYTKIKKAVYEKFKQLNNSININHIKYASEVFLLNLAPAVNDAVKDGYVLVEVLDETTIANREY